MRFFKAVLIDDEQHCLDTLAADLKKYCPEIEVVAQFEDPWAALAWLGSNPADVLFLDVVMPGMNGFEMLAKLGPPRSHVIFTTGYGEYALQALRISAVDYLQKPIDPLELLNAVGRLKERAFYSMAHLQTLLQNLESHSRPARLGLPTSEGYDFVPIGDILYFRADGNYSWTYFKGRERFFVTRSLKEMEAQVAGFQFYRIHHSYLINLLHVDRFIRGDGGTVVMSNGDQLPVSRSRRDGFWGQIG